MEETPTIPFCPPQEGELVPMLVVIAVFGVGVFLFRRWRKKRAARKNRQGAE